MNVNNHKASFSKVSQSDEQRAANKAAFAIRVAAAQVIANVIPNDRPTFNSSTPIAASISNERFVGGYQPQPIRKHNHRFMSRAYNVITDPEKEIRNVSYDSVERTAANKSVIEVSGIYKTMAERIESAGGAVSKYINVQETANTIAVRARDAKGGADFNFKHNAISAPFINNDRINYVNEPITFGFADYVRMFVSPVEVKHEVIEGGKGIRYTVEQFDNISDNAIAAEMASNGTARYRKPNTNFVKRGRYARAVNYIGGDKAADIIATVAFNFYG